MTATLTMNAKHVVADIFELAGGTTQVSAADAFKLRCETRAYLCGLGQMGITEAADGLQQAAILGGLLGEIGQDGVQAIMAEAFKGLAG